MSTLDNIEKSIKAVESRYKLYTASELSEIFVNQYIESNRKKIYFGFDSFDEIFEGDLKGQLAG